MSDDLFRVYLDPAEVVSDTGYPIPWSSARVRWIESGIESWSNFPAMTRNNLARGLVELIHEPIKDIVREQAGHRCVRCGHPYRTGEHGNGEWSACDEWCRHTGPTRDVDDLVEAQWRILTVHHLNGIKHDCRWWNLVALCQRCHLNVQLRVKLDRPYRAEHSEWFKPYAAGWYAAAYLGQDLTREQVMSRLDELLALEHTQDRLDFPVERIY